MKIAYLSTFYPFRGGIAQFNASLLNEFSKEHETKAFTFTRQYPDFLFPGTSQYVSENDKVDKIDSKAVLDTVNPFTYLSTAKNIKAWEPDLLIMKYWMPFFAPSLGYVAGKLKKSGTKVVSILDNVIPHEKRIGDESLTKYFIKRNNGFVVMSKAVGEDLQKFDPDAKFIFHQHPLYDHFGQKVEKEEARKALDLPNDKKVLLFFGFIRDYKGLDLLLEAVKKLPDDYLLVIAGEVYGNFSKYDEMIKELNIEYKVKKFVRYINDDEVPLFFSAADVCVQPYKSATQSGIVGISFHFDLPIIATDVGGLKEMIEPYGTGIIVDKPDVIQIVNSIQDFFLNDNSEYLKNIQNFKKICSWESLASNILDLYNRL